MKRSIIFKYTIALIFSGLFFLALSGCGDGDSGPAPVMHTVVSDTSVSGNMFGLAFAGTDVWVAYHNTSGNTIRLYRSGDTGTTFSQVFDTNLDSNGMVRAAVDSADTLYLFYRQFELGIGHHIAVSTMDDASTADVLNVPTIALGGATLTSQCLDISISGTTTFLTYTGDPGSGTKASYLSADFATATEMQSLDGSMNAGGMAGCMNSTSIWMSAYINYTDDTNTEVRFARTGNSGANWTEMVLDNNDAGIDQNVDIAAVDDNIVVSYFNDVDDKVYVICSADNGVNWSSPIEVASAYDDMTSLAVSTGYFNLVFTKNNGSNKEVYIARSSDNGATWTLKKLGTVEYYDQLFPEIQASGNTICIAFRTNTGIYFFRSTDNGTTWD